MAKFNLENYETVEDRLKVFWKDNPNGRISTEVVHVTDDGTCVTIKASVFKQEGDITPVTTGIAQETKGQGGFANTDAWVENCETSAIGRALANWKYQGSNKARPSKEEMSKVGNSTQLIDSSGGKVKDLGSITYTPPKEKEQEVAKTTAESVEKFTKDIGEEVVVADILNIYIDGFSQSKKVKDNAKKTAYDQTVKEGADTNVENWSSDEREMFYAFFEIAVNVSEVMGDIKDISEQLKKCPKCDMSEHIIDNREKKASDDKFANIPDFACSNYNADGCGWGGYIGGKGDREVPSTWL